MSGRALIVEDEPLVAMLLEDICSIAEVPVEAVVDNVTEAKQIIARGNFNIAILDVNLQGETSDDLADLLRAMPVHVIVSTGSHPGGLRPAYVGFDVVQKPFNMTEMIDKLTLLAK